MNIGLIDIDSHNFPNLALMKLSAWHKRNGDNVEFASMFGEYDIIYKSKIFTFTQDNNYIYNTKKEIEGGLGYRNYSIVLKDEIENICPDYSLYNYPYAMGFLTRGCIRKCSFCIVPNKEGKIKPAGKISQFLNGRNIVILLDNNVLASDYGLKQIEKIIDLNIKVDFNQGLDARIIAKNPEIAKLLSKIKWFKPLRMALDNIKMIPILEKAVKLLRKYKTTPSNYFIYVLVKEIETALERVEFCRKLNLDPFAQIYIDESGNKNKSLRSFARWVNRKELFKSSKWENFNRKKHRGTGLVIKTY
jgi:hypothetical protein